ncbi:MAG: hypothetical protein ACM3XM_05955 [Mycobacterium leprae]
MPGPWERLVALLCYVGALRVPLVALVLPQWAFTLPSGILIALLAWGYGYKRSPFLRHHGREGLKWGLEANAILAVLALLSKLFYYGWEYSGLALINTLWHFTATIAQWAGFLATLLTLFVMLKAARGETGDALSVR